MSRHPASDPLRALAGRLSSDPRYMAYALAAYRRQEGLSEGELAGALGTTPELLVRLALCLRPDADSPLFAEQLGELADFTLTVEAQLAHILRQVDSLEALASLPAAAPEAGGRREAPAASSLTGLLAAARDREEEAEESADEDRAKEDLAEEG
jgi:hypothetical protein